MLKFFLIICTYNKLRLLKDLRISERMMRHTEGKWKLWTQGKQKRRRSTRPGHWCGVRGSAQKDLKVLQLYVRYAVQDSISNDAKSLFLVLYTEPFFHLILSTSLIDFHVISTRCRRATDSSVWTVTTGSPSCLDVGPNPSDWTLGPHVSIIENSLLQTYAVLCRKCTSDFCFVSKTKVHTFKYNLILRKW